MAAEALIVEDAYQRGYADAIHEPALRKNSRNGSVRGYLRG